MIYKIQLTAKWPSKTRPVSDCATSTGQTWIWSLGAREREIGDGASWCDAMPGCHALNWTWSLNMPRERPSRRARSGQPASHQSGAVARPCADGLTWCALPRPQSATQTWLMRCRIGTHDEVGAPLDRRRRARLNELNGWCRFHDARASANERRSTHPTSPQVAHLRTILPKKKKDREKVREKSHLKCSALLWLNSRCFIC